MLDSDLERHLQVEIAVSRMISVNARQQLESVFDCPLSLRAMAFHQYSLAVMRYADAVLAWQNWISLSSAGGGKKADPQSTV